MTDYIYRFVGRRWMVAAIVGIVSTAVDVIDYFQRGVLYLSPEFASDILIHGVLVPLFTYLILTLLENSQEKRMDAEQKLKLQEVFSYQRSGIKSWRDLFDIAVQFPRTIVPFSGAVLKVFQPQSNQFELAACYGISAQELVDWQDALEGLDPTTPTSGGKKILEKTILLERNGKRDLFSVFFMPLVYQGGVEGRYYFILPGRLALTERQVRLLEHFSSLLVATVLEARARMVQEEQSAQDSDCRQIAHDLHDTIAQDLAILRSKLDNLSEDEDVIDNFLVRNDVEVMRELASEAYDVVRGTLQTLHAQQAPSLLPALKQLSEAIGRRSDLRTCFSVEGEPRPLQPGVQNHIFNIFREALSNIEKHSSAQKIEIRLVWAVDGLLMMIEDDGKGFEPVNFDPSEHFGLQIMQDRARQIGGKLTINSSPEAGTQIMLWCPLEDLLQPDNSFDFVEAGTSLERQL